MQQPALFSGKARNTTLALPFSVVYIFHCYDMKIWGCIKGYSKDHNGIFRTARIIKKHSLISMFLAWGIGRGLTFNDLIGGAS